MPKVCSCYIRMALILFSFFLFSIDLAAQHVSARTAVKNYTISQKRLLVINTAQFINFITQDNLDQDSVIVMACRITGMPFLLPYIENGDYDDASTATALINAGKISKAESLVLHEQGKQQIRTMLELAIWFLHQPGSKKQDMAKAGQYVQAALKLSTDGKDENLLFESRLVYAELMRQQGEIEKSKQNLTELIRVYQNQTGDIKIARAWQQLARLLPYSDSVKLIYLNKAISIATNRHNKEKEIELLFAAANYYWNFGNRKPEDNMLRILSLMRSVNYRHTMYAEYILAFIKARQAGYIDGLAYARAALNNMLWSGMSPVAGSFYVRVGAAYESLGQNEQAMFWFNKALLNGTEQTHIFWYKSLFYATTLLYEINNPAQSLSLLDNITNKFPPTSIWEKTKVLAIKGLIYQRLKMFKSADKAYESLLSLENINPFHDPFGEITDSYLEIAESYISQGNIKKASLFLNKAKANKIEGSQLKSEMFYLLFRIDSLQGKYKSALQNYIQFKHSYDSTTRMDQRKKLDEMTIKYAAEKKEKDIRILKQEKAAQQVEITQNGIFRKIMIMGVFLLFVIIALLWNQFRLKQRSNQAMDKKNKLLQHLLEEKEWLLKEVHHRVKNNLHTVISLLETQAAYLQDDALKAIESTQHRIYAMSLIHQKLYQSESMKTIDMSPYLIKFLQYLKDSFDIKGNIRFNIEVDPLRFGVSHAIPLALIINEAVTNSIKYAFPDRKNGMITISLRKETDMISLLISDDGIGFDHNAFAGSKESLGLKLMKGLSGDINALITIENQAGTRVTIKFDLEALSQEGSLTI